MNVSEARIAANQSNGAQSIGPLTPDTRAISAKNSFKHGLTARGSSRPPAIAPRSIAGSRPSPPT